MVSRGTQSARNRVARPSKTSRGGLRARIVSELADELAAVLAEAGRPVGESRTLRIGAVGGAERASTAEVSWYDFALEYLDMRWPLIAAKTRGETNEALCAITQAMLRGVRGRPGDQLLRRAMMGWAFVVPRPELAAVPADVRQALQ